MEKDFSEKVLQDLSPYFNIETQVRGTHFSSTKLIVDAVLTPKDKSKWKDENVCFGIEFKCESKLESIKDNILWINQCIDYADTNWNKYGYIHIFSCPGIFDKLKRSLKDLPLWNRLISNMGVGTLENHPRYGWTFYLQDSHRIWSQKDGVISGKHWSLKRKFGRRGFSFFEKDLNRHDVLK